MSNNQVQYTWKPEENFNLAGKDFEALINYANFKLNTPEAQEIIMLYEISKSLDKIMQDGVMKGKVKVITPEQPELSTDDVKEEAPN